MNPNLKYIKRQKKPRTPEEFFRERLWTTLISARHLKNLLGLRSDEHFYGEGGFCWVGFLDALRFIITERLDHTREMKRIQKKVHQKSEDSEHDWKRCWKITFIQKRQSTIYRGIGQSSVKTMVDSMVGHENNGRHAELTVIEWLTGRSVVKCTLDRSDNIKRDGWPYGWSWSEDGQPWNKKKSQKLK